MKKSHLALLGICILGGGAIILTPHSSATTLIRENGVYIKKEGNSYKSNKRTLSLGVTVKDENIFYEDFAQGLSSWATENASIRYYNDTPYAFLDGSENEHEIGGLQKNISGTKKGVRYRFTITGSGQANVAIDSSDYPIIISTGTVNMAESKTYTYEFTAKRDNIQITILSYGVSSGISNISIGEI